MKDYRNAAPSSTPPSDAAIFFRFVLGGLLIALLAIGLAIFATTSGAVPGLERFIETAPATPIPTLVPTPPIVN